LLLYYILLARLGRALYNQHKLISCALCVFARLFLLAEPIFSLHSFRYHTAIKV